MRISLDLRTSLTQTLTPQQIQYLKLLQLPVVQLEQQVLQELEQNPMLEVPTEETMQDEYEDNFADEILPVETVSETEDVAGDYTEFQDYDPTTELIEDKSEPFEFHDLIWDEDSDTGPKGKGTQWEDEDYEPFQIKSLTSFSDDLLEQIRMMNLSKEEILLGEQIIGNIDDDGYLRRDLPEIVEETNNVINEINYEILSADFEDRDLSPFANPAKKFVLSKESTNLLNRVYIENPEIAEKTGNGKSNYKAENPDLYSSVDLAMAERVLGIIQQLDPPGVGSRTVQECLLSQCKVISEPTALQLLARRILEQQYEAFAKKHFHVITKELGISDDELRAALDVIRHLNPKPGGGEFQSEMNTIIPDFIIEKDDDSTDLKIIINDSHIPPIRLNKAYEKLKKETHYKASNKDTKEWIRNKFEDAKFLIQAIQQRRKTMLKVMTAIAHLQRGFFDYGVSALKPLIYKDISEHTGLDISTVCRIVNGKYVQTEFGTFELKFFFSEALPTDDGEEVATRVIKQIIKEIIDAEPKGKPLSDDKIAVILKVKGYNVARRTVAKYREQLKIPVARLRKEL